MMAVFPNRRGCQAEDELGLDLPHHLLETESAQMVTFIGDHMSILGDKILYYAFALQAL